MTTAPPKIAFVVADLNSGGAERAALNLADALPGYNCRIVAEWRRGDLVDDPLAASAVFLSDEGERLSRGRRVLHLVRWLRAERPAVVVSMLSPAVTTIACVLTRTPVVHWLQAPLLRTTGADARSLRGALARVVLRWVGRRSAVLLGVTPGVSEECVAVGIDRARVDVLPNGLVLPAIGARTSDGPARRIVAVGRLEAPKRHDLVLRALARPALAEATLTIVGAGRDEASLRDLAVEAGVADRVAFTGFVPSPHPHLEAADVFVLATDYEGFGNVIVEAMAHGIPVVVSDVPHGPAYVLEDGRFGRLVPPGLVEPLADALAQALRDAPLAVDEATAVMDRAREFTLERVADRFSDQLERYASVPTPRG